MHPGRRLLSCVETGRKDDVTTNGCAGFFHLLKKLGITDDASRIAHVLAHFVESLDAAYDKTFLRLR